MTLPTEGQTPASPSLSMLARTTVIALVVAGAILVTIVLPAEYGIDPVGTGRWLGLTAIANPTIAPAASVSPDAALLAPVQNGPIGEYRETFKSNVFEITLQPYDSVEYKYYLEQGATMLYSWTASAPVNHEFHGERSMGLGDGSPTVESYDKEGRRQSSGSFTAPFSGIHGWFWENPSDEPISIRLTSSGFYGWAVEMRSDGSRLTPDLSTP